MNLIKQIIKLTVLKAPVLNRWNSVYKLLGVNIIGGGVKFL